MDWNDLFTSNKFRDKETTVFKHIFKLLADGITVYPDTQCIYKAFNLTPLNKIKVVILGQDPYHGPGQANGLAFSVNKNTALPPSLRNIFKELQSDLGGELRTNGDLSDWAEQGVLLLNSSLTVVEGQPNSMAALWEPITDEIISFIDSCLSPVVFVLWGNNAKSKKHLIENNKDFIIESVHPSPLSANRGFFGSKPFTNINNTLITQNLTPIIWNGREQAK